MRYVARDVRAISAVHDLSAFRRFMALVAARHGQVLNKSDLAAPLGMSVPGVGRWLDILEATAQILIVPPFFENPGKRLIKSPKVYVADSGLACHLLRIQTAEELRKSPFLGALFEGFVAAEIVKAQLHAGGRRDICFFRDQQGLEVDFLVPHKGGVRLIEAKASATVTPAMAAPMQRLAAAWRAREQRGRVDMFLVHQPRRGHESSAVVSPGVAAVPWPQVAAILEA